MWLNWSGEQDCGRFGKRETDRIGTDTNRGSSRRVRSIPASSRPEMWGLIGDVMELVWFLKKIRGCASKVHFSLDIRNVFSVFTLNYAWSIAWSTHHIHDSFLQNLSILNVIIGVEITEIRDQLSPPYCWKQIRLFEHVLENGSPSDRVVVDSHERREVQVDEKRCGFRSEHDGFGEDELGNWEGRSHFQRPQGPGELLETGRGTVVLDQDGRIAAGGEPVFVDLKVTVSIKELQAGLLEIEARLLINQIANLSNSSITIHADLIKVGSECCKIEGGVGLDQGFDNGKHERFPDNGFQGVKKDDSFQVAVTVDLEKTEF